MSATEVLSIIEQSLKKEFDTSKRLLSYDEFIALLAEQPTLQTRSSAQYTLQMMDFYGKAEIQVPGMSTEQSQSSLNRYKVFDFNDSEVGRKVVGHENVQNHIYRSIKTFAQQGFNNRLLLLHGPNGSAKSSIIHALMSGLEKYSYTSQGALYTFNWVFPTDKITKGSIGLSKQTYPRSKDPQSSFAHLTEDEILSRIVCEHKDHPLLLIPREHRLAFLEKLLNPSHAKSLWRAMPQYLTQGDLCHRCKLIFEALLLSNQGDYKKVLNHIQVERFYFSRRYRKGLATVEPQLHVDATYQQLTLNKNISSLPSSLQSLNLFSTSGDLIDGNRGIVEFSDLLKRPIDSFKYLLIACETGSVNVGSSITYLDTLMLGSTNEVQLDAFKEFPDFVSFKARIDLIRVPYLLRVSEERQIYEPELTQLNIEKHVAPHTGWALALWSVLSRLKKPNSINYSPQLSTLISNLTPLEKAALYDTGEMPIHLSAEDKKLLKSSIKKLRDEYANIPYYEGRTGASAREMKSILYASAQNGEFSCVSPLAVLREMDEFVKRVSEYDFLKQDVKDGYHDVSEFIHTVRNEYIKIIDHEVRSAIGLYDNNQWSEFIKKYVLHISLLLKKEKIKNPITGQLEDPDKSLIQEFEKIISAPEDATEKDQFRQNIISQVGAWSLDHLGQSVDYGLVFPEFYIKLEKFYFESQKEILTRMHQAITVYDKDEAQEEGQKLAQKTIQHMCTHLNYCEHCAKEVIGFLMRTKY